MSVEEIFGSQENYQKMMYDNFLHKCLKKNKQDILGNPHGFIRGVPTELAEDMMTLALDEIQKDLGKQKLERLLYICNYMIENKPKRANVVYDKFTVYEEQAGQISKLLKRL